MMMTMQRLADTYRATPAELLGERSELRAEMRRAAREPLAEGEWRTVTVDTVTVRMFRTPDESGRCSVETEMHGEIMNAFSATWETERAAALQFYSTVMLALR